MTVSWIVVDPFGINVADVDSVLQETLIELQSSHTARARFLGQEKKLQLIFHCSG